MNYLKLVLLINALICIFAFAYYHLSGGSLEDQLFYGVVLISNLVIVGQIDD